ncbi:MAG: hypothetical protein Q4C91_17020 [Eubacteriales bacterium]|nr:hypothetical protein [Eubacteriales bacterium]
MRTKKTVMNLIAGFGGQLIGGILSFVARIVFVKFLSAEYLGVNGLFSNILAILALSDLGIGTAIVYSLYEPVAKGDEDAICRLMNLYKYAYRVIALVIFVMGTAICPFLNVFIKGDPGIEHLRVIYMMYLLDVVASYLVAYKTTIFHAEQKIYVRLIIEQIVNAVRIIFQIVVLALTGNFILYLLLQIIGSLFTNLWVSHEVDKTHPYLKHGRGLPDKKTTKDIIKNVKAMSMHRLGTVIVQGTDNMLMSVFVGLTSVGIYSNYNLIISNVNTLFYKIYNALVGGVGNLVATEEDEKIYEVYRTIEFALYLFFAFVSAGLICFFNPVVRIFFGEKYLFSMPIVACIVINFYITGMRQANLMFRDAMGLFWYDRYKPVAESVINLIVSVYLVRHYEVIGIFIGTIVSSLTVDFWVEPYVLMKYGMKTDWKKRLKKYFALYGIRTVTAAAAGAVSWMACCKIPDRNLLWIIVKIMVFSAVYLLCMAAAFSRKREFQDIVRRAGELVKRILKKK